LNCFVKGKIQQQKGSFHLDCSNQTCIYLAVGKSEYDRIQECFMFLCTGDSYRMPNSKSCISWIKAKIFSGRNYFASMKACVFIITKQGIHSLNEATVLYYGFFFPEETANSITNITTARFQSLLTQSSEFKQFVDDLLTNYNLTSTNDLYAKPLDPNTGKYDPYYHVTTKYCGSHGDLCPGYGEQVDSVIGHTFETTMVGFVFTNRTYGIRVNLTAEQRKIFDNDARKGVHYRTMNEISSNYPGIRFEEQPENYNPTDTKAHVTIGTAPRISAVTTGPDLLEVIAYEKDASINRTTLPVEEGHFVTYRNGDEKVFVLYPHQKMIADTTFEPYLNPFNSSGSDNSAASEIKHCSWFAMLAVIGGLTEFILLEN